MKFTVDRTLVVRLQAEFQSNQITPIADATLENDGDIVAASRHIANIHDMIETWELFAQTQYIGPFRNALNVSQVRDYYDISVGNTVIISWHNLKTGTSLENFHHAQSLEKEIEKIFGFERFTLDASADNSTFLVTVNNRRFRLQDMAQGLPSSFSFSWRQQWLGNVFC